MDAKLVCQLLWALQREGWWVSRLNKYVNNFAINVNKNGRRLRFHLVFFFFALLGFFFFFFFATPKHKAWQKVLPKYKLFIQSATAAAATMASKLQNKFMQTRSNSIVRCDVCLSVCPGGESTRVRGPLNTLRVCLHYSPLHCHPSSPPSQYKVSMLPPPRKCKQ